MDPVVTSAQVTTCLQTVVSRPANLPPPPALATLCSVPCGRAPNILPQTVYIHGSPPPHPCGPR